MKKQIVIILIEVPDEQPYWKTVQELNKDLEENYTKAFVREIRDAKEGE